MNPGKQAPPELHRQRGWRVVPALFKEAFDEWSKDKASRLAAALAYYTVFSLAPLLIIVIATIGLVFGRDAAQGGIMDQIGGMVGKGGVEFLEDMVRGASQPRKGVLATVFGLVTLLLGASGVFAQLQDGLNTVWEVEAKPDRPWLLILRQRFASFTMVIGVGFLLLVSLVINAAIAATIEWIAPRIPGGEAIVETATLLASFAVVTLLFAAMFKLLPDVEMRWRDVWVGAAVTSLLFTLGKFAIAFYLGRTDVASSFGAAGSLVLILVWVYYSAQIVFFGAEFTQVYASHYGAGIKTAKEARPLTDERKAEQGIHPAPAQPA